jgi:hypothetical protein
MSQTPVVLPSFEPIGGEHASIANISVLHIGKRLEITANVDAAGLKKLKELIPLYEEILKLAPTEPSAP